MGPLPPARLKATAVPPMTDKQKPPRAKFKWYSSPRDIIRYLLGLDDTHHAIALGTTIGVFVGMTPTVGIQMILVMVVAFLAKPFFHFNRVAALITVYISNPVTMVPIYYLDYKVGTLFFESRHTVEDFQQILHYNGFAEWWQTIVALFVDVGMPLLVGSLIVASVCAAPTYPLMRYLLKRFHGLRVARVATSGKMPSTAARTAAQQDAAENDHDSGTNE